MPRLRLSPLPVALRVGALAALLAGSIAGAFAESSSPSLLRPELYGDPKGPAARFQKAKTKDTRGDILSISTFQPASGAGTTGFDSSGKRKAKGKARSRAPKFVAGKDREKDKGRDQGSEKAKAQMPAAPPPPLPSPVSRYGSPDPNPYAPTRLAVPRPAGGVARKGASPYYVAPDPPPDAPPPRRRAIPDDTPFDPIGVQVGAFNFKPAIELSGGYDTNPARTQQATPSWYSVVAPELKFNSNWSRHEFTGDLRGSYYSYENLPTQNRPNLDGKLTGRIDVTRDTRVDLETKYLIGTDNPGSPNIQAGLAKLPIFQTFGGTAGLGHRSNRFDIAAKSGVDRTIYQDSTFTDGSTASNEDRNYNRYNAQLRGSYELTPGMKPFLEVGGDRRVHDLEVDFSGFRRNSDGRYVKGGTTFEFTRILTGDVAVGWLTRHYEDATLLSIKGLTFDASLTWAMSALTAAKLTAVTRADESRVPGVSGVFTREVTLQVDHAFRRWLLATGKLVYGNDDYVGSDRDDNRYSASAAITYKLTRDLWLKSEYRHDWLRSSVAGSNYDADVILFTLRAQR
ncbi:MAG: outer membrane beta-barrel protein [Xanthobacteraceae bacterium]|nr:outer membrane beta-barrel protein [Xanthobacteraceae bacterium]